MKVRPYGKTMSSARKYEETKRLAGRLRDIYSQAHTYHLSADRIREMTAKHIYQNPAYRLITESNREYLRGIRDTLSDQLWSEMVWRLGPAEGPLPESEQGHWPEGGVLSTLCRIPGALYGGHYWAGTDTAFTEYRCTNPDRAQEAQG